MTLSPQGVQVGQQRLHVPWNDVTAIATIERARGAWAMTGLAVGALAGALIGAGCEDDYIFRCTRFESAGFGAVIFGITGTVLGLVAGRTFGYTSTWLVQGPRHGD